MVKTRHNAEFKADEVKAELGLFDAGWEKFKTQTLALAKRRMSQAEAVSYLIRLMGDESKPVEEQPHVDTMKVIADKFATGNYIGHELSGDSAWGLVNCVTEYVDHVRGRGQDRRLEYGWFGGGMDLKMRAFEVAGSFI